MVATKTLAVSALAGVYNLFACSMQKTVAAAIFKRSIPQLKTQHSWQQPSRALSSVSAARPPALQKQSPVCAYNEWDLLEVIINLEVFITL